MKKKKYQKGLAPVKALSGLGQFAGMYGSAFNDKKAAKYGNIVNSLTSVANTAVGTMPGESPPQQNNDIYGLDVGKALAKKGMRVTKKKKGKRNKKKV